MEIGSWFLFGEKRSRKVVTVGRMNLCYWLEESRMRYSIDKYRCTRLNNSVLFKQRFFQSSSSLLQENRKMFHVNLCLYKHDQEDGA